MSRKAHIMPSCSALLRGVVMLSFALWGLPAFAASPSRLGGANEQAAPFSDLGWASLKMAGSLLLVLGVIVALYFLARRLRAGAFRSRAAPTMRLLGTLSLAPRRSLALVEVQGQWLLLGVGAESVTYISRLDPDRESGFGDRTGQNFESILKERLFRGGGTSRGGDEGENGRS